MRMIVFSFLALLVMHQAWANDTAVHGAGGTVKRLAGEHASIRMVHETVRLEISPRYYDVQAEFLFHNAGKATTVTMGFPESGVGDGSSQYRNRTAFQYFRTTVDGKPVTARRQPGSAPEGMSYQTWWTKEVTFAARQQRRVTVAYRAPIGEDSMGERWALYQFTGGNWAGTVGSSHLHVRLHLNGTYAVHSTVPLLQNSDSLSAVWHDWEAEETAVISFRPCGEWDLALRGLKMPRERSGLNWLSPDISILHLRTPGITDPEKRAFIPAAFINPEREGAAYISLRALQEFIAARYPNIPAPEVGWDSKTKTGAFSYLGETLRFSTVPDPPSPLDLSSLPTPVAILRAFPHYVVPVSYLYVPVDAVSRQLGMSVDIDYANHLLTLHYPMPQSGVMELDGKPCRVLITGNEVSVMNLASGQRLYRFTYPLPATRDIKAAAFIPPMTIGTHLLLSHADEGKIRLHGYDLAIGCAAGKLVEAWQADLSSHVLLPAADGRALYLVAVQPYGVVAIEKRALADGSVHWRRDLPRVPADREINFIADKDGRVALYAARWDGEGIIDPAEVLLLDAGTGALLWRYWCTLDDAVPERLPRWASGPKDTRALLNADGRLLAASYGHGLWRTDDGASWARLSSDKLPAHLVSLAVGPDGAIAAGSWMADGLLIRTALDPALRLLSWPNRPRWPSWWSREYSRCMAVGFCGNALYVQSFGGFLRWTARAGWERTAIPATEEANAVINDSGIWTATAEGKTVRVRHYTPAGTRDLDVPIPAQASVIAALATSRGQLYLVTSDCRVITCTVADLREYAAALAKGRHPLWGPEIRDLLGSSTVMGRGGVIHANQSVMIYAEPGYRPVIIAGTSKGPLFAEEQASARLDPSLARYNSAFATWRDASGDWLALGGIEGVVLLPASVIRASLGMEAITKTLRR